ncbi:unnamed protein product, partial [Owenia fusiformis]
ATLASAIQFQLHGVSRLKCARTCFETLGCTAMSYLKSSKSCTLYELTILEPPCSSVERLLVKRLQCVNGGRGVRNECICNGDVIGTTGADSVTTTSDAALATSTESPTTDLVTTATSTESLTTDSATTATCTESPTTDPVTIATSTGFPTTDSVTTATFSESPTTDLVTSATSTEIPTTDSVTLATSTEFPTTDAVTTAASTEFPTTQEITTSSSLTLPVPDVHITFDADSVSGTTIMSTVGTIIGTLQSSPAFVSGKVGNAVSFSGTGQRIDFGNQRGTCLGDLGNCASGHTMVFWFYHATTLSATYYYISTGGQPNGAASHGVAVRFNLDNTLGFYHSTPANEQWATELNNIAVNTWYHVSVTWRATGGQNVYINGVLEATNTASYSKTSSPTSYNNFKLGTPNNHNGKYGKGMLDEFRFYDAELSSSEIAAIYSVDNI